MCFDYDLCTKCSYDKKIDPEHTNYTAIKSGFSRDVRSLAILTLVTLGRWVVAWM